MTIETIPDKVAERLAAEAVIWLTTVRKAGAPAPTPVWFLWSGGEFLILTQPDSAKMAHLARNSHVSLNFNGSAEGGEVSVFTGLAVVDPAGPTSEEWESYLAKYGTDMTGIDYTPERFLADYSVLLRIRPESLRGW